jgi:hypothetical protein
VRSSGRQARIFGDMRGSSSYLGDCQWTRQPSRAEIPVDRESHGIRPVEGIGCARFQVAGKVRAASCQLAGATGPPQWAPDTSGAHCREEKREGRYGRRLARVSRRACGGCAGCCGRPAVVPARREDQLKPGAWRMQGSRAAASATWPGPGRATDPLPRACTTAGGRQRPAARREPSPATPTTDCRHHPSRFFGFPVMGA